VAKPTILTVDDDPAVSQAITRDLRRKYGAEHQIVRATSGADALTVLAEFALRDRPVALIASDQRMPGMTGVEFLEQARRHAPDAKLVLLTAYADTDVAIKAIMAKCRASVASANTSAMSGSRIAAANGSA
jgi:thioredoxin reductase (NADPH)